MPKRLTVIPERCSGCRLCEVVCALHHFGMNNPKKAAIRVISLYPHPVIRMPVVCRQCAQPKCRENCPTDAISVENGVVQIDADLCVSCQQCVISCPFGAIFVHDDIAVPFKCDLCGGRPQCVLQCPKGALCQNVECFTCPCPGLCETVGCAETGICPKGTVCEPLGPPCGKPSEDRACTDAVLVCVPGCHMDRDCDRGERCMQRYCLTCPCPGVCSAVGIVAE